MASVSAPWGTGLSPLPTGCCNAEPDDCVAHALTFNANIKHLYDRKYAGYLHGWGLLALWMQTGFIQKNEKKEKKMVKTKFVTMVTYKRCAIFTFMITLVNTYNLKWTVATLPCKISQSILHACPMFSMPMEAICYHSVNKSSKQIVRHLSTVHSFISNYVRAGSDVQTVLWRCWFGNSKSIPQVLLQKSIKILPRDTA